MMPIPLLSGQLFGSAMLVFVLAIVPAVVAWWNRNAAPDSDDQ